MGTVTLNREQLMQVQASARVFQERADNSLQPWGLRAPQPVITEDVDSYRRKLLILAKKQLPEDHPLRGVQIRQLASDALDVLEPQIYDACQKSARRSDTVPLDAPLRRVETRDANGLTIVDWVGRRSFVHDHGREGRRVVGFYTPQGFRDVRSIVG
jgi:hypothetical protein